MSDDPKRNVRRYYEEIGWSRTQEGLYQDTAAFVDNRQAVRWYHEQVARRPARLLPKSGNWFLDAGCGALPAAAYLETAKRHRNRVCLDFSATALHEARKKLDASAMYVQADVSHLPFRDAVFSAVLSAHVVYHLPDVDQRRALVEFVRVLQPGGKCAVIYTNPDCLLNRFAIRCSPRIIVPRIPGARWLWRRFFRHRFISERAAPAPACDDAPALFFNPKPLPWIREALRDHANVSIRCWASAGLPFTTQFIPDNRLGALMLRILFMKEHLFPRLFGRMGAYPLLLIRRLVKTRRSCHANESRHNQR